MSFIYTPVNLTLEELKNTWANPTTCCSPKGYGPLCNESKCCCGQRHTWVKTKISIEEKIALIKKVFSSFIGY